jgi:hypothetical protein
VIRILSETKVSATQEKMRERERERERQRETERETDRQAGRDRERDETCLKRLTSSLVKTTVCSNSGF